MGAVLGTLAYRYTIRPRLRMWGATPEEIRRPMAGDEMVPHPSTTGTRAITIAARPDDVWPWLVQIGYGRAGFYSYAWIERLMGLKDIANSDRVMPEYE
ncbi:MAG TPA: hypothetical protein VET65_00495, partial [Candidatus Limnocylindrales bacterium]|nr:hypothetical protein [Candidatus Limnocylindrales bacterium]